jgi:phosphatidylglycerophosphate synthase
VEKSGRLPFSLPAFLVAPWPVPLVCSALLAFGGNGRQPAAFFAICLAVSVVISYLGTAALVVCLHFVAQARPVTRVVSAAAGVLLAALGYLPLLYLDWSSSGPDSGPPVDSFAANFLRNWDDPFALMFLAGGLVTALTYDTLARWRVRPPAEHGT